MPKYMGTISAEEWNIVGINKVLEHLDVKEAYIAREIGTGGFQHYQYAIHCSGNLREYTDNNSTGWHVEDCISWELSVQYCQKTGKYMYIGNSPEERYYNWIRKRGLKPIWKFAIAKLASQNDRQIDVWIDTNGAKGKSTTNYLLQRRGFAFCVDGDRHLKENIAMNYNSEPIMIVDIPRAQTIDKDLINLLESLKDGIIATGKYQGSKKYIRGVKILVFTNHYIPDKIYEGLTEDRWRTYSCSAWERTHSVQEQLNTVEAPFLGIQPPTIRG